MFRTNLAVHHQEHCSVPDDERVIRSKHVEQEKNSGIKIIYKNSCISLVIYALQYDARYIQRQTILELYF